MNPPPTIGLASAAIFDEHLAEKGQAKTRLWSTVASLIFIALRWMGNGVVITLPADKTVKILTLPSDIAIHLSLFFAGYGIFGLIMLAIINRYPGHFVSRRLATMFADFGALTYTMVIGGNTMMPFYAFILWVTVGNGMRFGRRYLLIAAILAQVSLVALMTFSSFWLSRIDVIITFSLTALALPVYSVILLRHTANARDAAMAAMQAKSRFLAQASHDLRQPVHAIGYYLDILRETDRKAERIQLINRVDRSLGAVARLFKSLLDIARIDSGTVDVRAEVIALRPLLADIIQQNEQIALWHDVELRIVPTSQHVRVDPTLLATMVQNLLSNAIKYARGSKVLVGVRRKDGNVSIEIHDQGIGIEAEHMPHIFDEFYRAHIAGDHDTEGVGLGLAIVSRLSQISGLVLDLRSQRGVGTIAAIHGIPSCAGKLEPKRARARTEAPQPLAGFRVILIEDDRDVLDATRQLLERWGCEVQASPGIPLATEPADLIIADFDLGKGELGTVAIADIRRSLGTSPPAILLTGHAEALVRDQVVTSDIQILAKPVQPAMLRSIISAFRLAGRNQA
jgi:signal transduction histidine kinase